MLELLPDVEPGEAHEIFQLLPWWATLHYTCQAASILMLELSLKCEHLDREEFDDDQKQLLMSLEKAMKYMWLLAATSRSAEKAWTIFRQLFEETMALYPEFDTMGRITREIR